MKNNTLVILAPIAIGAVIGVINLGISGYNAIQKAKFNRKIKKGLEDGSLVEINGQYYEVQSVILGHAVLENRSDGVYAYASFNDTESAQNARKLIAHGDIKALSIYANNLKQ